MKGEAMGLRPTSAWVTDKKEETKATFYFIVDKGVVNFQSI